MASAPQRVHTGCEMILEPRLWHRFRPMYAHSDAHSAWTMDTCVG